MFRWTLVCEAMERIKPLTPWRFRTGVKGSERDLLRVQRPAMLWRVLWGGAAMVGLIEEGLLCVAASKVGNSDVLVCDVVIGCGRVYAAAARIAASNNS